MPPRAANSGTALLDSEGRCSPQEPFGADSDLQMHRIPRNEHASHGGLRLRSALLLSLLALAPEAAVGDAGLLPLPDPRLESAEVGLRERLEEARTAIAGMLEREERDPAELARAFGELGRLYLACGLNVAAAAVLHNATVLEPETFRWHYYLGALQHQERRLEESEKSLRRALELAPGDLPSLLRLADVVLVAGRPAAARELYSRALELAKAGSSEHAFAHHGLGRIAVAGEDWASAAAHFEAALAAAPEASALRRLLALAYRELGDVERARAELRAGGAIPVAFADPLMDELAGLDTGGRLWAALAARRRGDLEQAVVLYRQAIAREPGVASYHRSLADVLALRGEIDGALAALERALELEPEHVSAHLQLGELRLQHEGSSEAALASLRRAVALAPEHREARLALGRALAVAQRHDEALPHYDEAVARDPRDPRARFLRARSLARLGRDAAAAADLEAVLAAEPGNVRARLDLATVLARQGESRRALELFETALELELDDGDRVLALFSAASLRQQQGDAAAAILLYRAALELAPDLKDAHFNLAAALASSGQDSAAAEHFRRAVELDPADADARLAWARSLFGGGDCAAAREALAAGPGDDVRLVHTLAQVLLRCPDPASDGAARAVELAREAVRREPTLQHAGTLARALAAARRFEEAVAWQRRVVADAERAGVPAAQLDALRQTLRQYESLLTAPAGGGDGPR